jgi:transposase
MKHILERENTAEFKEQAVAMVNNGRSMPQVAGELGLIEQTLRNWVRAAERGRPRESYRQTGTRRSFQYSGFPLRTYASFALSAFFLCVPFFSTLRPLRQRS